MLLILDWALEAPHLLKPEDGCFREDTSFFGKSKSFAIIEEELQSCFQAHRESYQHQMAIQQQLCPVG